VAQQSEPARDLSIDVDAIVEPEKPSAAADSKTAAEEKALYAQEWQTYIESLTQDKEERKKYAKRIFVLLSLWLGGVFVLLVLQGIGSPRNWFQLDDSVLLAAIGGTTINVIGIFLVVARYLFPQRSMSRPPQIGN